MNAIGGYFELELTKGNQKFHHTHALKSGRTALHFILNYVKAKKIYIPFYTCNALLEPIKAANIKYEFYEINKALEPKNLPQLEPDEYFLYINYFDLKRDMVEELSAFYTTQLIVDCSQAFFLKANGKSWYFNSCRKFFGVPDGGYLYAPENLSIELKAEKNKRFTAQHLIIRKSGNVADGYPFFLENEILCDVEIKQMSIISEELLSNVDYEFCKQKRIENFAFLQGALEHRNLLQPTYMGDSVPMTYPFLPDKPIKHQQLWNQNLFIPVFWNDVLNREEQDFQFERILSANLLPIPIDHRYSVDDMNCVLEMLQSI